MLVTKISPVTGKCNTLEIPISEEQYHDWLLSSTPIQRMLLPWLSEDHREFLMTGLIPEDWANIFNNKEVY